MLEDNGMRSRGGELSGGIGGGEQDGGGGGVDEGGGGGKDSQWSAGAYIDDWPGTSGPNAPGIRQGYIEIGSDWETVDDARMFSHNF